MKFSCEKVVLQNALSIASRAVSSKSAIPALEGLLLDCSKGELVVTGYNMQLGIRTRFACDGEEDGQLVLNAKLFGEIVRKMPDDTLTFSSDEKLLVKLHCGDTDYEITGLPSVDFPELPEVEEKNRVSVSESMLRAMIQQTCFAVSTNEARPVHMGSLFEISGGELTIVSVDGFRLALRREKLETAAAGEFSFVAPGTALSEVEKVCEDVKDEVAITLGDRHILFEVGQTELICRRLEGEFLDYKNAIPRKNPIHLTVETKVMTESLDRVSVVISEKLKSPVRCLFSQNKVTFSAKTASGEAKDVCRVEGDGKDLEIGFNNRYLSEALRYAPADMVLLELNSGISPAIIVPVNGEENFLYMVLPVRLKA
ncbi:MAG: DNA polymerase III subunit beta [Oscillospiraceae bacterium]|nr:DNA polymerase III subunit beta [Oscillospiraceae bacterium]